MLTKRALRTTTALVAVFTTGWAFGATDYADRVNAGLVQALNSVGQNLFGSAVFSAGIIDPDILPNPSDLPTVQMDFSDDTDVPMLVNFFFPPDPVAPECQAFAQVSITPEAGTQFIINPDIMPLADFVRDFVVAGEPEGFPPGPCRDGAIYVEPPG